MHPALKELLFAYRLENTDLKGHSWLLRQPQRKQSKSVGHPYTRRQVERLTHAWGAAAEAPNCLPHRFRHAFATDLLRQGTDIQPAASAERERLQAGLVPLRGRLDGLRRFVEQGDTSSNVRRWLAEVEQEEERLRTTIERLDGEVERSPLQVHPRVVEGYLRELGETLVKGGQRLRQVFQADVERIVIHPVRPDAAKPFARAEVITTGKGLLDRVALMGCGGWIC